MDDMVSLDDETLARAGLVRRSAYVRVARTEKAMRQERHRKKRVAAGTRQINIEAPDTEEARKALRRVAASMRHGAIAAAVVIELIERERNAPTGVPPVPEGSPDPFACELARLRQVLATGGWRARALRWLAGRGVGTAAR
jgi:thioredoxin-like negative regulator of GroEL